MREVIEVETFEWAFASDGAILNSGGLGPCIAIGLWSEEQQAAVLGHWVSVIVDKPLIIEMLEFARRALPDSIAYLTGICADDIVCPTTGEPDRARCTNLRNYAAQLVRSYGFTKIVQKWTPYPWQGAVLIIDTLTGGEFEYFGEQDIDEG